MEKIKSFIGQKEKDDFSETKRVSTDEGDNLVVNPILSIAKSQEFDPVTSRLEKEILEDEYTAIHVEDDSPYPEVRASVPSTDDWELPQNTIRMWTIGMILTMIGCGMNTYFSLHSPSFSITMYVTSILAWPIGKAWHACLPNISIFGAPLNPGPFNLKEHALISIMANVNFAGGAAYATDILLAQNRYYKVDYGWGFDILLILCTQCIGFGLAGVTKKVLVDSPSMIWPQDLVATTFLTNMHINENHPANGWRISRLMFFSVVFSSAFVWYWFPGFIFQALSYFAWPTWIAPNNIVVNQVFGASQGLGIIPLTFDWNQIAGYIGSPLIPPASTIASILFAMVTIYWIITPALYYTNTWYGKYLPISSSTSYDRYQASYNVTKIVKPGTLSFDPEGYKEYSPLFLSTTFAISYGLSFASILATLIHTGLFHGKDIIKQLKQQEKRDVHNRLMERYKPVPEWWYIIVFVIFFAMAIATIEAWDTEFPVWGLIVALLIAIVFLLPVGVIFALTNIAVGLNVVTEFIVGYMIPGKGMAMMLFKTFGYITNSQAIYFVQDMKLGHYMKLKPRVLFSAQMIATIWGCIVQIAVLRWSYGNIEGLCDADQPNNFTCPNGKVFFTASIIWGVIGPGRIFSHGQIYYGLLFFFIIGAVCPIANWLILKKWPNSPVRWLNWPVFFSGTAYIPPATPYNYGAYCLTGLMFGYVIKRKFFHWWTKYNYSLSAGLDIGLAWSSLIIFLAMNTSSTHYMKTPKWWGNDVISSTLEGAGVAYYHTLEDGQSFGPSSW
ncbi:oligopeptide transporter 1 [[Candida] railenensis]|uniref:Oligopeptide transporter 1 n=1 Tax=[Candida] railenensis TaxID=45579 RepID=A0A9P0W0J6_9ASCO|nr:oligopeptide transporter 1 [[Candida] railenensis]